MTPNAARSADTPGPHTGWGWLPAAAFCAAYVLLDWASYIDPLHHLNITPWNPAPALGLLYLLRRGPGGPLVLFLAIVATDLVVRDLAASLPLILMLGALLAVGYSAIAVTMRRYVPDSGMFADRSGLAKWTAIVVFGALFNGLLFVSALVALGLISPADWHNAVLRFWIGDAVGVFVVFPLLWWLQDRPGRRIFRQAVLRLESVGYVGLVLAMLWLVFATGGAGESRYLYALFLPVVWAASRQGLLGAVFCSSLLQLGMLLAGALWDISTVSVFELQIRALLIAGVGFVIGTAVDEQRRAAAELKQSLRLAAAGEMAAALAHELNQPLTALAAYGAASELLVEKEGGSSQLRDVIRRMVGEAGRAAEVVRRLRDFFRTGATNLERFALSELIDAAAGPFREKAATRGYELRVGPMPEKQLHADRLQIEVVLRNLLSNAADAVEARPAGSGRIEITAELLGGDQLCLRVADNGPGLATALLEGAFEPFVSTKSSGLGLGLAISRAIVEAHGGRLVAEPADHGRFALYLPIDPVKNSRHG